MKCPNCGSVILSKRAQAELEYMRKVAPGRGGFMYEGARSAYESGEYNDDNLKQLLEAGAIEPHPDPTKGWIVK